MKLSTNDNNNSYLFDGSSNIQKKEIINLIGESYKLRLVEENLYIIEDVLLLNMFVVQDDIKDISIEACFSWYNESIGYIYEMLCHLRNQYDLDWYLPDQSRISLSSLTDEDFRVHLSRINKNRYEIFKKSYGTLNKRVLPRKWFYESQERGFL